MTARSPQHKGLPARWTHKNGAYYYIVPPSLRHLWDGKSWFRLGASLPEAYRVWANRLELSSLPASTIGQLLDRYAIEVLPTKAPKTATENLRHLNKLRTVFGDLRLHEIEPQFVYQYFSRRGSTVAAKREIEVLSHAFTKAVEWGLMKSHPFKGEVRLSGSAPRTRYVEDREIEAALSLPATRKLGSTLMVQAYLRLKLATGLRQRDLLQLTVDNFTEDGLLIEHSKTRTTSGKRTLYRWTDELREIIEGAIAVRPSPSSYLFCKTDGTSFVRFDGTSPAFAHLWSGFMDRLLASGAVTERFTEHDLRAKVASDASDLEHARALLGHADSTVTQRVYRRKVEVVQPLQRK